MKGTVKSKEDVERLFRKGERSSSYLMTVIALPAGVPGRMTFIAGKKTGTAPFRNRCKRVMRDVAHQLGGPWDGYDVVFVARKAVARSRRDKVVRVMREQLEHLEVL